MARLLLGCLTLLLATGSATLAQQPSPQQAQQLLQTRPELVAELRQRILASGMTAEQVRNRLRAEGYPETLLDPYLSGAAAAPLTVGNDVLSAIVSLGIADTVDIAMLRRGLPAGDTSSARLASAAPAREPDARSRVFGLDVFKRSTSQFDPNVSGPVDANYRLGPGDRLVLVLTGDVEAAYTLDVTREGFIVVPQAGEITVANLTLSQLEDLLYARLGRVYSGLRRGPGATTRFSVSPVRLRSNQVYVIGDVNNPGSYRISAAGTVLTALYAAGGPSSTGTLRRVELRRSGRVVNTLDVYDYLLQGDASRDPRLENGDVVFVPVHGPRVELMGEVLRPATYELKTGETLADVIRAAGGFRATADRRRVQIERIVPATARERGRDRIVIDIASEELASSSGPSFALENGDVVRVFTVTDRVRDRVTVRGNVWAPGPVGFTPGMRISDAIRMAGGVKPDVYLGQLLVSRLQDDSARVQLRSSFADTTGTIRDDFLLTEDDEVEVFSVTEFRPKRYVAIAGAVRNSGQYPYREGMTLRDLLLMAGGLEESAFLQEVEIARLPDDRSGGRLAETIRVPLDSSFVFERRPEPRELALSSGFNAPRQQGAFPGKDILLRPYDNVLVLQQPDWDLHRTVAITGEVRFPGRYSLRSKDERLSDLIARAGGLTPQAYPGGVHFNRQQDSLGRIGIDLSKVLRDRTFRDNVVLEKGDSIYIPAQKATVDVTGAVNSPVAVAHVPGRGIEYYIRAAGGLTNKAAGSRAYVAQPDGKVESRARWGPDREPKPRPGSTVVVPEKDPEEGKDRVQAVAAIAQVLGSLVAIIAVIAR